MSNPTLEMTSATEAAESIEAAAWEDLFDAAPPRLAAALGLHADRCSGALVLRSHRLDHLLFNRTFGLGMRQPSGRPALESAVARYRSRDIDRYLLHLCPEVSGRLRGALQALGLERFHRNWIKLGRGREGIAKVEAPFHILPARAEHLPAASRVLCQGFELPEQAAPLLERLFGRSRWHLFVAVPTRAADQVVASAGALFVDGDTGYLAMGATLPAYRGRGAQRAVMVARVRRALELGCRALFTETGEPRPPSPSSSYHNMLYCGFRPLYSRENWGPPGLTWSTTAPAGPK